MNSSQQIDGVEMPKRIWLMCYRHAGDVCWTSDPNPEDADEIETVEYVRADSATTAADTIAEMVAALKAADVRLCALVGPQSEDAETCAVIMQIRSAGARALGIKPATEPCAKVEKWTHG